MSPRLAWRLFTALVALTSPNPAWAQLVFRDSFETPCAPDADGDRLDGCQEDAALTDPANRDTDGDGLGDGDEVMGTLGGLDLPGLGVSPRHKDILLEYDWFDDSLEAGSGTCPPASVHSHRPTQAQLEVVTVMYGAAPVSNPDGVSGIKIIHDIGQGGLLAGGNLIADADGKVVGNVFAAEYVSLYEANFAQNRRGYFHYVLMPHRYVSGNGNEWSSGYAEIEGTQYTDSMMVSLYCTATTARVGNTIAHELGHNLKLHHGGEKTNLCNNKPNYNSVMNYLFQFDGVDNDCHNGHPAGNPADFSQGTRLTINEAALSEPAGMCAGIPTDWNANGSANQVLVNYDVNPYPDQGTECGGVFTQLSDHDDWAAIVLPIVEQGGGNGQPPLLGAECPTPPPLP